MESLRYPPCADSAFHVPEKSLTKAELRHCESLRRPAHRVRIETRDIWANHIHRDGE